MSIPLPQRAPRPTYFWPLLVLLLLAAAVFRLWDQGEVSLWYDEYISFERNQMTFAEMIERTARDGTQVPLYYIVMHYFPSNNPLMLRLPAILLGVLNVAVFVKVIERLYGRPNLALWAGVLLTFNPFHVWLSRQARFYPLFFLLVVLSTLIFLYMVHQRRSPWLWLAYILVTAAAYVTHYFGLIIPMAQYLYMFAVVRNDRRFLPQWLGAQALALSSVVGWFIYARSQPGITYPIEWIPEANANTLPITFGNLATGFTGTLEWYFVPALALALLGTVLGLLTALRRRKTQPVNLYWVFLLFVPTVLIYVYSTFYLEFSIFMDRYFMGVLPGAIMLMLLGWQSLGRRWPRLPSAIALVFLLSATLTIGDVFSSREHEMYDWQATAAYFEERQQPGDGVMFPGFVFGKVFNHYYPVTRDDDQLLLMPDLYFEADLAAVERIIRREQVRQGISLQRMWVFCRNPDSSPHRTLLQPDGDPFAPDFCAAEGSGTHQWLLAHRDDLILHHKVNGVQTLLFEYQSPAWSYPAP